MPTWWAAAAPIIEAASIAVALLLGVANLSWLVVQARRSAATHSLALEAHDWAKDRRAAEIHREQVDERKAAAWSAIRDTIASSDVPILIPADVDPSWVHEGAQRGHFRIVEGPEGRIDRLWRR